MNSKAMTEASRVATILRDGLFFEGLGIKWCETPFSEYGLPCRAKDKGDELLGEFWLGAVGEGGDEVSGCDVLPSGDGDLLYLLSQIGGDVGGVNEGSVGLAQSNFGRDLAHIFFFRNDVMIEVRSEVITQLGHNFVGVLANGDARYSDDDLNVRLVQVSKCGDLGGVVAGDNEGELIGDEGYRGNGRYTTCLHNVLHLVGVGRGKDISGYTLAQLGSQLGGASEVESDIGVGVLLLEGNGRFFKRISEGRGGEDGEGGRGGRGAS